MSSETLAVRRDRALGAGAPLFYNAPLHIVRGEGVYLFDADGRRYVDMYNNVPCVGHANPHVVEAMARQQGTLNVHSRYLHEGIVAFAERLSALCTKGPQIESVVFSCSGTEANEVALRMARIATGKTRHRLHQRDVSRQQRGGRQADADRRRSERHRRRARHSLPRDAPPAGAGRQRSRARGGLSRPPARRDPQPRGATARASPG